jgi:hypothetical protein
MTTQENKIEVEEVYNSFIVYFHTMTISSKMTMFHKMSSEWFPVFTTNLNWRQGHCGTSRHTNSLRCVTGQDGSWHSRASRGNASCSAGSSHTGDPNRVASRLADTIACQSKNSCVDRTRHSQHGGDDDDGKNSFSGLKKPKIDLGTK